MRVIIIEITNQNNFLIFRIHWVKLSYPVVSGTERAHRPKFKEHQTTECHKVAVDFEKMSNAHGNIIDMANGTAKQTRNYTKCIQVMTFKTKLYL